MATIAPFGSLRVLKCGHGGRGQHEDCQYLIGPEQDDAAGNLVETNEGQIANQCAAECSIENVESQ
jgi:hypothetical protein